MASMLETPSRIWRRIEAEGSRDMPSLPSVPGFDDDDSVEISSEPLEEEEYSELGPSFAAIHSTPAASTVRAASSTSSTTRFANSLARSASISARSSLGGSGSARALSARQSYQYPDSFEISAIPSLPEDEDAEEDDDEKSGEHLLGSRESAPEMEEGPDLDISLTDALESISRTSSPHERGRSLKEMSYIEYEVPLKSSPKATPFSSKFRHVAVRRPMVERTRTPSLSRTTLSPASSPTNSTPRSGRSVALDMDRSGSVSPIQALAASVPLPMSNAGSPAVRSPEPSEGEDSRTHSETNNTRSMDITEAHISPIRQSSESQSELESGSEVDERVRTRDGSISENTFSTDDGPTPYAMRVPEGSRSPEGGLNLASAFSSPAPSMSMATPTPAFPRPRPRARFNLPSPETEKEEASANEDQAEPQAQRLDEDDGGREQESLATALELEDPITPQTRRRSFFLSVINSTTRPRMKFPTPHPHARNRDGGVQNPIPDTPSGASVMASESGPTPLPLHSTRNGVTTFALTGAGTTPRPRYRAGVGLSTTSTRASHPLAQTFTAGSTSTSSQASLLKSDSESGGEGTEGTVRPGNTNNEHIPWSTPALGQTPSSLSPSPVTHPHLSPSPSPYDDAALNGGAASASFISTASSHDLTTHHRANTSFDPAMGFGLGGGGGNTFGSGLGGGVGRFNAGKLNTYLHGLNRRLQEENEGLLERLRKLEETQKSVPPTPVALPSASTSASNARRQSGGGTRRLSAISNNLGDLPEEEEEEAGEEEYVSWLEEKAQLEEMVETFKAQISQCLTSKAEVEQALEQETAERARDKERWKERMREVQEGVEAIVRDLEGKLHDVEEDKRLAEEEVEKGAEKVQEIERRFVEVQAQRDDAAGRAAKAEEALANHHLDLGGELKNANDRVSSLLGDLRNANSQIKELEQEILRSEEYIDGVERDLGDEKQKNAAVVADLQKALEGKDGQIDAQRVEVRHLEQAHQKTEEMLTATQAYVVKIEEDAAVAVEQFEALEEELGTAKEEIARLKMIEEDRAAKGEQLAKEAERAAELARQMEEALEAAEKKMIEDEDELADVKGKLAAMERERERQKELSVRSVDRSANANVAQAAAAHEAEIEALEHELDEATKEIARLNTVLSQSPARKAMDKAKNTKIEMLEQENEALSERIKALRVTMNDINTPSKMINNSGISPMHRRVISSMSIRAPRTPGGPLRDMSWLNNTADPSFATPLVTEISRLQRELDRANESIDDKLEKLEDAGLGVVGLTKKLEDARSKIRSLEDQIDRLSRREERRVRRLGRARCKKCLTKVGVIHLLDDESGVFEAGDDSLPTEPPTPPTKTSEALRANLRTVNSQLEQTKKQWQDEKRKLLGEKAVLQDAANRLNVEVRDAKAEAVKASEAQKANGRQRQDVQKDLENAQATITELEKDLKAERARLRAMSTEQNRVSRDKEQIFVQLQRTETDIEDVRSQLQACKKENRELENELRANANIEQRARLLEVKVAENVDTMEHLREERALLATDYKDLQKRYAEISEHANRLLDSEAASRKTHDDHRHQLDIHLGEIEDLRKALSERSGQLHRIEAEKNRIAIERSDVAQTVATLEADLKRVRENAEAFGRDLKELRTEKERLERKHQEEQSKADRNKKQTQTQIRLLTEQLEGQRAKTIRAREELENHVCAMDDHQLSTLKLRHNKEAKGLIVQIRYLKAKFTRESMLRFDLAYQKHYLLVLLNKFETSEQTISAAIARIGFPVAPPAQPKKRKLKSIVRSIVFLARVKKASDEWRKQTASRQAIAAALDDVHQRRAAVSKS